MQMQIEVVEMRQERKTVEVELPRYFCVRIDDDDDQWSFRYGKITENKMMLVTIGHYSVMGNIHSAMIEVFNVTRNMIANEYHCGNFRPERDLTEEKFDEIKNQVIAMLYEPPEL